MKSAGARDTRVTIEQKIVNRSDTGAEVPTWVTFDIRWASMTPLRGREFFAAEQTQSSVDYRVVFLRPLALEQDMRLVAKGKTMDIVSIIESDTELEVMCSTGIRNAL